MNSLDLYYQELLLDILNSGVQKQTRNGTVLSVFGKQIRHNMKTGFPLLTTKKMAWKQICTELAWFLRGHTDIRYLWENDCHIWDGDYQKSGRTDYSLGPIYGKQWRSWKQLIPYEVTEDSCKVATVFTDQIAELIEQLKTNPDSRRLVVSAWNVGELDQMVLPPCHYGFQVYTRELSLEERNEWFVQNWCNGSRRGCKDDWKDFELDQQGVPKRAISLMWNQRSVDTFLGLPFNIASYGLLLEILAKEVNMVPEELIGNLGDTHLYMNHVEQAKEQINRKPYELPKLIFENIVDINNADPNNFKLDRYLHHPAIKAQLSN